MFSYCQKMTQVLQCVYLQVKAAYKAPRDNREHELNPGDRVYIKIHQVGVSGQRWFGPHMVLFTAPAAVKTTASPRWIHTSHVK